MSGSLWVAGDPITASRSNQKQLYVASGVNIASANTYYAGQLAFCTTTGSGFEAGMMYQRNAGNTAWQDIVLTNKVKMLAATATDYATPTSASGSSTRTGDSLEVGWVYTELDTNGVFADGGNDASVKTEGAASRRLVASGTYATGDYMGITKSLDLTSATSLTFDYRQTGQPVAGYLRLEVYSDGISKYSNDLNNFLANSWYTVQVSGITGGIQDVNLRIYGVAGAAWAVSHYFDNMSSSIYKSAQTIDDDTSTYWSSASESTPSLILDTGALRLMSGCRINWRSSGRPAGFDIDVREDAESWTEAYSTTIQPASSWGEYAWNTGYDRYLRIQGDGSLQMEIAEADYYSKAIERVMTEHGHGVP